MSASGRNPSHIEHFIGQRREHYKDSPLPQAAIEEIIVLERRALETLETLPQLNGAIAQLYQHDMISEAEAPVEVPHVGGDHHEVELEDVAVGHRYLPRPALHRNVRVVAILEHLKNHKGACYCMLN